MQINPSLPIFEFSRLPKLSRLAWCAQIKAGERMAQLDCGSLVEEIPNGFAAGAWDGDYREDAPDHSATLAGSAGRALADGFVFAAPSHTLEWLQYVRVGNTLYISNSLPLLLAETDDGPDLAYPDYFFDLLETYRAGLSKPPRSLPTAHGRWINLVVARNLHVGRDLSVTVKDKPETPAPECFEDVRDFLQHSVNVVVDNARDPRREHPFRPRVTVSRGYDSVAVAALAAKAGCLHGLTFRTSSIPGGGWAWDNGRAIGEALGMTVDEYAREKLALLQGHRDAEFYIDSHAGTDKNFLLFFNGIEGALFMTGRSGENCWSLEHGSCQPALQEPSATLMSGASLIEFALCAGFLHFPVPACGAIHAPALDRISRSPEMQPWQIGGNYDRPIPRRIAEEAGVPRAAFGQRKHAGAGKHIGHRLSKESREDLRGFLVGVVPKIPSHNPLIGWLPRRRRRALHHAELWLRAGSRSQCWLAKLIGNRFHPRWRNRFSYTFHWGLTRTTERYAV
ncbi:MAG: hypothetical protein KJO08_09870, partial [Gammaproteobacteria bacterium]|nr:hypothetical protein [Gammaproteobacteria bacterium]NNJ84968.1 hypothetical protein [Gammaproteobacteria bacterium]